MQITPSYRELLANSLTYKRRIQEGVGSKNVRYVITKLYREEAGSLLVSYGCFQRVLKIFQDSGVATTVQDLRKPRLPDPIYTELPELRQGQDGVILTVATNEWATFEAPTGFGKTWVMVQICKMWPTGRILILSPADAVNKMTFERLRTVFPPHEVGLIDGSHNGRNCRITCSTMQSMLKSDVENIDIILADEVHRFAAPESAKNLSQFIDARRYGFSASPYGRSDNADLETEALFGPLLMKITYQETQAAGNVVPVEVIVWPTDTVPELNVFDDYTIKRHGIWQNTARHICIADSVNWAFKEFGAASQVLILVDTIEHGLRLKKLLPDFTMVYANMSKEDLADYKKSGLLPDDYVPLKPKTKEILRKDFESGKLRRVIATTTWGTGVDFPFLNVLVRAEGASGNIPNTQYPGRITRPSVGKTFGIVIHPEDCFCTALAHKAEKCFAGYRSKGWNVHLPKRAPLPAYLTE